MSRLSENVIPVNPRSKEKNVINTSKQLTQLCHDLACEPMIGLDTEFIREKTYYPHIALIQVASPHQSVLIDPLAFSQKTLAPFLDILQDKKILKIFHAAQGDQECFLTTYHCLATPIFDTAEAASLCGFGNNTGLAALTKTVLHINLRKGNARAHWKQRPLPPELTQYALADVDHLIPLAQKLMDHLKKNDRLSWAMELSRKWEDPQRYQPDPHKMAEGMAINGRVDPRGHYVLKELNLWREKLAQKHDVPRRRIADNDILIALANARPLTMDHLASFRGLRETDLKNHSSFILKLMKTAESLPPNELPKIPKRKPPSPRQKHLLDFLQFALKDLAEQAGISPHLFLSQEQLSAIVQGSFQKPEDLLDSQILKPSIYKLIGPTLWALLTSKKGLTIHQGHLKLVDLPFEKLIEVIARLRAPGGCPWDREQTHASIIPYLIEEAHEAQEALAHQNWGHFKEELGDVLCQIIFHALMAQESSRFNLDEVCQTITEKLIRRHPHVFAGKKVKGTEEVLKNWEQIKKEEKKGGTASPFDSIPHTLPALLRAYRLLQKAERRGLSLSPPEEETKTILQHLEELKTSPPEKQEQKLGHILFALVDLAKDLKINPETALLATIREHQEGFETAEKKGPA